MKRSSQISTLGRRLCLASGICAGLISGLTAHAGPDMMLQRHLSLAQAEVAVAEANVAIHQRRVKALHQLRESESASWVEVQSAEAAMQEAATQLQAATEVSSWINQQLESLSQRPHSPDAASSVPSLMFNFKLPGSRAIIGWINVATAPEPLRTKMLSLLEEEARVSVDRSASILAEQRRMESLEDTLAMLQRTNHRHTSELEMLQLRILAVQAKLRLIDAEHNLRDAEMQDTLATIADVRAFVSAAVSKTTDRSSAIPTRLIRPTEDYHERVVRILHAEAESSGQVRIAETLQQWSDAKLSAAASLQHQRFASTIHLSRARFELESLSQMLDANQELQQLRIGWLADLQQPQTGDSDPARVLPEADLDFLSVAFNNPGILRETIRLVRESALLRSQLSSVRMLSEMQGALISQLNRQATRNSVEIQQAELMAELLAAQTQHATEQLRVVELARLAIPDLAACQESTPVYTNRIEIQAAEIICLAATRQHEQAQAIPSEHVARNLQNRLQDLTILQRQGNASRQEVLAAEQQLLDLNTTIQQSRAGRMQSDLRRQLTEAAVVYAAGSQSLISEN